ncbi:MAG: GAF domain-containing protein [Anaerolineales bacterium]|nr:GAF domain-containing protein [Anaerolineales bacterium]
MAENKPRKHGEDKLQKRIQNQFKTLFSGEAAPPSYLSIQEVEALQKRVAELEAELADIRPMDKLSVFPESQVVVSEQQVQPARSNWPGRIGKIFAAPVFDDEEKGRTAYLLNFVTIAYLLISLTTVGGAFFASPDAGQILREGLIRTFPVIVVLIIAQIIMRFGKVRAASIFLGVFLWITQVYSIYLTGGASSAAIFVLILVVLIFGLLVGRRAVIIGGIGTFLTTIIALAMENSGLLPPPISEQTGITAVFTYFLIVFLASALLYLFRARLDESVQDLQKANQTLAQSGVLLQQRMDEATQNLSLAAEVGRRLSLVRELDSMLSEAVEIIRDSFGLYYTQIYLTDTSGRSLVLRAGTGDVGQTLLRRGHRLSIDLSSLNGVAATERRTVIVGDTEASTIHRPNPLLPDTRSEMVVPLLVGDRVVGVLDMQSDKPGALSEENPAAFEALAGQLAIAISNADLFETAENARTELESQIASVTTQSWRDFLDAIERGERIGYTYDQEKIMPLLSMLPEEADGNVLVAPVEFLGTSIGKFQLERDQEWTEDDNMLANAVARQVAQQVENLRLLAQAEQYQAEAQEALRRLTREGWEGFTEQWVEEPGYVYKEGQVDSWVDQDARSADMLTFDIKVRDDTIGQFGILGMRSLSSEDAELIAEVSQQLSTHVENLRLSQQTEQALARTDELYGISQAMNEADTEEEVLAALVRPAQETGANSATLMYLDLDEKGEPIWAEIVASWYPEGGLSTIPIGSRFYLQEIPLSKVWIADPDNPVLISDVRTDKDVDDIARNIIEQSGVRAMVIVPLTRAGERIALVIFSWQNPHEFSQYEKDTYSALIGLASPAVQGRRLFEQVQARAQREQTLRKITEAVRSTTDTESILKTAVRELGEILGRRTVVRLGLPEEKIKRRSDSMPAKDKTSRKDSKKSVTSPAKKSGKKTQTSARKTSSQSKGASTKTGKSKSGASKTDKKS